MPAATGEHFSGAATVPSRHAVLRRPGTARLSAPRASRNAASPVQPAIGRGCVASDAGRVRSTVPAALSAVVEGTSDTGGAQQHEWGGRHLHKTSSRRRVAHCLARNARIGWLHIPASRGSWTESSSLRRPQRRAARSLAAAAAGRRSDDRTSATKACPGAWESQARRSSEASGRRGCGACTGSGGRIGRGTA